MRISATKIAIWLILIAALATIVTYVATTNNFKKLQIEGLNTQIQIERLQSKIAQDSIFIEVNREAYNDMLAIAQEYEKENKKLNAIYITLAAKYKEEKQKVKDLPAIKSVEYFLEANRCPGYQAKYYNDNSVDSTFIIPIQAIKNANLCAVESKSLAEMNSNLISRVDILTKTDSVRKAQIDLQNESMTYMENQKNLLNSQILLKDNQIKAYDKAAGKEKIKLRVTQISAAAIIIGVLILK